MAQNFSQKAMAEGGNQAVEATAGGGAKFAVYGSMIFIIPIFWYVGKKNWFRRQREKMQEQLNNIDAKLSERYNALANQFNVAKAALAHEKGLQQAITEARAKISGPASTDANGVMEKNRAVSGLTGQFNMVMEKYPEITVMPMMQQLMTTVKDLESDLEANRRFYNRVCTEFNSSLKVFPTNVVAAALHEKRQPMFEAEDHERKNVALNFNNDPSGQPNGGIQTF